LKFKFNASATGYLGILFMLYAVVQAVVGFNNVPSEMERGFASTLSYSEAQAQWTAIRIIFVAIPSTALAVAAIFLLLGKRVLAIASLVAGYISVGLAWLLSWAGNSYWTTGAGSLEHPEGFIAYAWGEGFLVHYFGSWLWTWDGALSPVPFLIPLLIGVAATSLAWVGDIVSRSVKVGFEAAKLAESDGVFAPNSGTSIAAMVLAIVIPWLGIVLAYVARNEIKRSQGKLGGARLVQLALVVGYSMVALQVIAGVIYAVVILLNLPK
jgi:hypothetical protein